MSKIYADKQGIQLDYDARHRLEPPRLAEAFPRGAVGEDLTERFADRHR